MTKGGSKDLDILLERAGLKLTDEEKGWVEPIFDGFREELEKLHALDLEGEEVPGAFLPQDAFIQ